MEDHTEQNENDYSQKIETLSNMFGDVLSQEAISAIVISCDGDLEAAVETIIDVTSKKTDTTELTEKESVSAATTSLSSLNLDVSTRDFEPELKSEPKTPIQQPTMFYAARFSNERAEMVETTSTNSNRNFIVKPVWTEQQRRVIDYHNKGYRIMIILRGAPGCGKTYLAKRLVEMMIGGNINDYKNHIFSSDDYFIVNGRYQYDRYKLSEAHNWNHNRVLKATKMGLSPIIVDNTNTELWEMDPYVKFGVFSGYLIEVMTPNTQWANNSRELARRNTHNVSLEQIKRMLSRFQCPNITNQEIIASLKISYPYEMTPPVMRLLPPFKSTVVTDSTMVNENTAHNTEPISNTKSNDPSPSHTINIDSIEKNISNVTINKIEDVNVQSDSQEHTDVLDLQKRFDEIKKVELEWDQNESWDDDKGAESFDTQNLTHEPLQKRTRSENNSGSLTKNSSNKTSEAWKQISMFMPPWNDSSSLQKAKEEIKVEKNTASTCISLGDTDINNTHLKILTCTPRDINFLHVTLEPEKIPKERMLDKSTTTNELNSWYNPQVCQMAEHHFKKFRKMFYYLNESNLRDIFEKCGSDVNWAVQIVLDGIGNKQFQINDNEKVPDDRDDDDDDDVQTDILCNCLAAYDITPDFQNYKDTEETVTNKPKIVNLVEPKKKIKKDKTMSVTTAQLKQEIERNIKMSEEHYSSQLLKIKRFRHGNYLEVGEYSGGIKSVQDKSYQSSSSNQTSSEEESESDDAFQTVERTVNIELGRGFISQLDNLFGRNDMKYPEDISTTISLPMSMLHEINALWVESLMHQLDEKEKKIELIKRDEDFARKLLEEDAERLVVEKNLDLVPDFKQIMDEDLAVSIYQKEVNESLKNKEPTNFAAKITRDKLFNLFPGVSKEALTEVLIASGNNFKATVESLLVSMGDASVLDQKSVDEFVSQREKEIKEQQYLEQSVIDTALQSEILPWTEDQQLEAPDAQEYRNKAYKHLELRNRCLQKIEDLQRRGIVDGADHYRQTAEYHSQNYEFNTYHAASIQMKLNAQGCDSVTLDMHEFRVKEAKTFLDIFLDKHISKLREESSSSNSRRSLILYLITGRGIHSPAGPRLKPAVIKRLRDRSLGYRECNPGLLATKVSAKDMLTYQLT